MFTHSGLAAAGSSPLPVCAVPELSQCLHCYRIISKSEKMRPVSQKRWLSDHLWEKKGQGSTAGGSLLVFFKFIDYMGFWQLLEGSIPCSVQLEPEAL